MAENPHVKQVRFVKSAVHPSDFPDLEGMPELAVAGRSNVGKSSLINGLVNRRRLAKVSNTPGRTQLLNFFVVNEAFSLCDLPGYGYAKVPLVMKRQWGPMIERYLEGRDTLRGLLLLMDARREPGEWETGLIGWCSEHGIAVIPVVTKIDKLVPSKRMPALAAVGRPLGLPAKQLVGWSAPNGDGLEDLWGRVVRVLGLDVDGSD